VVYPTVEQVCDVNRRMIDQFGGAFTPPYNLNNLGALEYILGAIASGVYGYDLYPTLKEKAAAIAYHIISRHVFLDGNKRTGIHIAWEFLKSNETQILLDETIVELAVAIATGNAALSDLHQWLHSHQ